MTLRQELQELEPIFKAYNLRPNRLKELKVARLISREIEYKVFCLVYNAGITY